MRRPIGTSGEVATLVGAELVGPGDVTLVTIDTLELATEGTLTFLREKHHLPRWAACAGAAVIVTRELVSLDADGALTDGRPVLIVDDADLAMITLLETLDEPPVTKPGIDPTASIDPDADVAPDARVGPHTRVGAGAKVGTGVVIDSGVVVGDDAVIGDGSVLHSNVVIYPRCEIGRGTTIHAGAVIGADGFGYRPSADGRSLVKVPHIGHVKIGDGVEIGANATIDRGKFGATSIGDGTKIDNLVMIGHNCQIGRCCVICGCAGISGSVVIGDGVTVAGGVGIADNLTIGDGATIGGQAGVMGHIPPGATVLGSPARDARRFMRNAAVFDRLDELMKKIKPLLKDAT